MNAADEDYPVLINDEALIFHFCDQSVQDICDEYISPYLGKKDERSPHETVA